MRFHTHAACRKVKKLCFHYASINAVYISSTRGRRQAAADAVRVSHAALPHRVSAVSGFRDPGPSGPEGASTAEEQHPQGEVTCCKTDYETALF